MKEEQAKKLTERIKKEDTNLRIEGLRCTTPDEYSVACFDPIVGLPIIFESEDAWDKRQAEKARRS